MIIQEIFSVNSHIKRVTDGSSAGGYVAPAPAIFDRAERTRTLDFFKQYLG